MKLQKWNAQMVDTETDKILREQIIITTELATKKVAIAKAFREWGGFAIGWKIRVKKIK